MDRTSRTDRLAQEWEAQAWAEQSRGHPRVAQALWRCARELRHLTPDDEAITEMIWPSTIR